MTDLTLEDVRRPLEYIANSPPPEHGGFHPEAVAAAKNALEYIDRLEKALRFIQDFSWGSLQVRTSPAMQHIHDKACAALGQGDSK